MTERIFRLLFPPKCVLCRSLLTDRQTDFCHHCRTEVENFTKIKFKPSFVARWTGVWYYKDDVRSSILRYKFNNKRHYAGAYARKLAIKLQTEHLDDFDVLTWVPVGSLRRLTRGYDQVELLANALGQELNTAPVRTLKKIRNTPPQSGIRGAAARRANVLGAFRVRDPAAVKGKRILLLDDVITTGATSSECAKTLMIAGAKQVYCAAVAAASHHKK